jgi:hypothetical protein
MKVTVYQWCDNYDYSINEAMYIDNKRILNVYPLHECPEDACIGRDLISCRTIANLMKQAVDVTQSGESFEYHFIECKCDPDDLEGN